jgi:hypothetical protein
MTRKDSEKEADRPHYYSQFWLDVAAGRKVIGGGLKTDEAEAETEADAAESEPQEPVMRRSSRPTATAIAHEEPVYAEPFAQTEAEPEDAAQEFAAPDLEEAFPAGEEEELDQDQELPNILVDEETEVPDMDLADEDEEDFFDEEEEEEEGDDDMEWGRGRKKPKPGRQTKQPPKPPVKRAKRDRRY